MKKLSIYITLISATLLTSCVDEITPDFEFKEQVFISGLLSSEAGFVSVQIQKTVPVTDTTFSAVNDAQVLLFTRDASNTISLVSDSFTVTNGNYTTSEIITPTIGNTYWIEVKLEDQTVLRSQEESLQPPIPIIGMVKNGNTVRVTFIDKIEEQNFYFIRTEVLRGGVLISDNLDAFDDRIINENSEKILDIDNVNNGDTVRVSIDNINFTTFQFYLNVIGDQEELAVLSLFSPINITGNITNTTTNELALGNFGVAGLSTMTMDF